MAAPKGNQNAKNKGVWRDAIRRALAKNKDALDACAAQLVAAAMNGDLPALKELGDRLDGKPTQMLGGDPDSPIRARLTVEFVNPATKGV